MLAFKEVTINFGTVTGTRQRQSADVVFDKNVRTAQGMLKGYNIRYTNGDHHILEQEIDLDIVRPNDKTVRVFADFVLRDSSGVYDDGYRGFVNAIVVADLVD